MSYRLRSGERGVAFSVTVTPQKRKSEDEVLFAILAPFNKSPKVTFENVPLNTEVGKCVYLRNPTSKSMQVKLDKLPEKERGFHFNSVEFKIEPESQVVLEIRWTPVEYGSWHDNIKICQVGRSNRALAEIKITSSTADPPKRGRQLKAFKSQSKLRRQTENKENIGKPLKSNTNSNKISIPLLNETFSIPNNTPRRTTYEVFNPSLTSKNNALINKQISTITKLEEERQSFESIAIPKDINTSLETAAMKLAGADDLDAHFQSVTTIDKNEQYLSKQETYEIPFSAAPLTIHNSSYNQSFAVSHTYTQVNSTRSHKTSTVVSSTCSKYVDQSNKIPLNEIPAMQVDNSIVCSSSGIAATSVFFGLESTSKNMLSNDVVKPQYSDDLSTIHITTSKKFSRKSGDSQASTFSRDSLENSFSNLEDNQNIYLEMIDCINFDAIKSTRQSDCSPVKTKFKELSFMPSSSLKETNFGNMSVPSLHQSRFEAQISHLKFSSKQDETFESQKACLSEYQHQVIPHSRKENLEENNSQEINIVHDRLQQQQTVKGNNYGEIFSTSEFEISDFAMPERNPDLVSSSPLNSKNSYAQNIVDVEEIFPKNLLDLSELISPKETLQGVIESDAVVKAVLQPLSVKQEVISPNVSNNNSGNTIEEDQETYVAVLHPLAPKEEPLDRTSSTVSIGNLLDNADGLSTENLYKLEPSSCSTFVEQERLVPCIYLKSQSYLAHEVQNQNEGSSELGTLLKDTDKTPEGASDIKGEESLDSDQHDGRPNITPLKQPIVWTLSPPPLEDGAPVYETQTTQNMSRFSLPKAPTRSSLPHPGNTGSAYLATSAQALGASRRSLAPSVDIFRRPKSVKRVMPPSKGLGTSPPKMRRAATQERLKRLITPSPLKRNIPGSLKRSGSEARYTPRTAPFSRKRPKEKVPDWLPVRKLKFQGSNSSINSECSSGHPTPANADPTEPNPFLAATSMNPFIKGGLYMGERWLQEQERELINWTNNLLQPPSELQMDRDQASNGTGHRLNTLRATIYDILMSDQVATVLAKIKETVERKIVSIRKDKDLHADLGLQDMVLKMLMSYNPLWLRLCLEAVYQCTIIMKRHDDNSALIRFIRTRVLNDSYLYEIYSHPTIPNYMMPEFEEKMKKFTLNKFLTLVYILDQVKTRKIILHDPCLFRKDSDFKSSKDILIEFNKEFIAAGGDIVKKLRVRGYEVSHTQTYLDEFDFSLACWSELRDGVRLTKLAEIITRKKRLCRNLRVPALNSLQKKFNAEVAFSALKDAGFPMLDYVSSKDIADGHKENTLSFIWHIKQVVEQNAVILIIKKWRETKDMREDRKRFLKVKNSIIKLQRWYRRVRQEKSRPDEEIAKGRNLRQNFIELRNAVIFVQRKFREKKEIRIQANKNKAALLIQNWYRNKKAIEHDRALYKSKISAVSVIQRAFRNYVAKNISLESGERKYYLKLKQSAIVIQQRFRACKIGKKDRNSFIRKCTAARTIQTFYRSYKEMYIQRQRFLLLKQSVILIQTKFRAYTIGRQERESFLKKHRAVLKLQKHFRACREMKQQRQEYLKIKQSTILIQKRLRAYTIGKQERDAFLKKRWAALKLQKYFRAYREMKLQRQKYLLTRQSTILIQNRLRAYIIGKKERESFLLKCRAAITIQTRFRTYREMKIQFQKYILLKHYATKIQRRFRANIKMKQQRQKYLLMKQSAILIQRRFRTFMVRKRFMKKIRAVLSLQSHFRAYREMKQQRQKYLLMKRSAILIQNRFRAYRIGKKVRESYLLMCKAARTLQARFRAYKEMKLLRQSHLSLKHHTTMIQRRFRANIEMKQLRQKYILIKQSALVIQTRYRAYRIGKEERDDFLKKRKAVLTLQKQFRAYREMKQQRQRYLLMKRSAILIQNRFRAYRIGKKERESYLLKCKAATTLQTRFRAYKKMKLQRRRYLSIKHYVIVIQRRFRANIEMKKLHQKFLLMKRSALLIQRSFKTYMVRKRDREFFMKKRRAALTLQKHLRAYRIMKQQRERYLLMKQSAILIQNRFRAYRMGKKERESYLLKCKAATTLQTRFRAYKKMKLQRQSYLCMKNYTTIIQRRFRAKIEMKKLHQNYIIMKQSALVIQRRLRAYNIGKQQRDAFLMKLRAVLTLQKHFRAYKNMKQQRQKYLLMKKCATLLQNTFRGNRKTKMEREHFLKKRNAAITIQKYFRSYQETKHKCSAYLNMKRSALVIQRNYRAFKKSKQEKCIVANVNDPCFEKRAASALKIQAWWRGMLVRRKVTVPKPALKPDVPQEARVPIEQRVRNSMRQLLDPNLSLATGMYALANLVTATILSANACDYVVEHEGVRMMFYFAECSTKTLQNDRCVELAYEVLMSLYRSPNTAPKVWEDTLKYNGIETIVDNMLKFRLEKTSKVFCKAASLFWLFSQDPGKVSVIKKVKKVVDTINYLQKKSTDFAKPTGSRVSSTSSSNLRSGTASSRQTVQRRHNLMVEKVPSQHPNWGNYFEHCLFFVNKETALKSLVKSIGV